PFRPDPAAAAELAIDDPPVSSMDAVAKGTRDGIVFLLNIVASLVVMVALVSLVNSLLGLLPAVEGDPITLQRLFAYAFRPVMWLIGIPGEDTAAAATLMGTKTVLNEFIAYVDLSKLSSNALSERSRLIMTYALCGFANFGSLGILIGGMGATRRISQNGRRHTARLCRSPGSRLPSRSVSPNPAVCFIRPSASMNWRGAAAVTTSAPTASSASRTRSSRARSWRSSVLCSKRH